MNNLTTKKHMPMQTWRALNGARSKLRSKVKFFNFVPFSCLIYFVHQRRKNCKKQKQENKTKKNVVNGTQTIPQIKQIEKSLGPVDSVFLIIF